MEGERGKWSRGRKVDKGGREGEREMRTDGEETQRWNRRKDVKMRVTGDNKRVAEREGERPRQPAASRVADSVKTPAPAPQRWNHSPPNSGLQCELGLQ